MVSKRLYCKYVYILWWLWLSPHQYFTRYYYCLMYLITLVFTIVGLQMGSENPTIWNLNKCTPFCQKPLEIQTKMSGFWTVWTIAKAIAPPFENWTIWNLIFKKSILNVSKFQIPNVRYHSVHLNFEIELQSFWQETQIIYQTDYNK